MSKGEELRGKNPFHEPLVTELIEDPKRYRKRFSETILIGETLQTFQPNNTIVLGPQGSGKSMLMNLIRYRVITEWLSDDGEPPKPLETTAPYLGISINLVRANFHAFGRRSVSKAMGLSHIDESLETTSAADFMIHYLLREFLLALQFIDSIEGARLRRWFGIKSDFSAETLAPRLSSLSCWFGYYQGKSTISDLLERCEQRLNVWRSFLNTNIDHIPDEVRESKATWPDSLHELAKVFSDPAVTEKRVPLFVVIDQYEVLPELNRSHGTTLQQLVNTFIKARDPVVFYKIGARTHDWGQELRVVGADSRIEVGRDYGVINLASVLMRQEQPGGWIFPSFAADVAVKRCEAKGFNISQLEMRQIFGQWTPNEESRLYFKRAQRKPELLGKVPSKIASAVLKNTELDYSPLDLRLSGAWIQQQVKKGLSEQEMRDFITAKAWETPRRWWRKERVEVALLQVASIANQKRLYYGWRSLLYLSGGNITAFLLICAEIWDEAARRDIDPLESRPLPVDVQSLAVHRASEQWRNRDRNEQFGGSERYEIISRLGSAIHNALVDDRAMSNPGHSGFSIKENDLIAGERGRKVSNFLNRGVNWGILEERQHTSKQKGEGGTRRKWYLHPLFAPAFAIPFTRVKEPLYTNIETVYEWFFENKAIVFGTVTAIKRNENQTRQVSLFGDER